MAINSKSKVSEILADPRALAIVEEYLPTFGTPEGVEQLGPAMSMRIKQVVSFPQAGLSKEAVNDIVTRLDALDA